MSCNEHVWIEKAKIERSRCVARLYLCDLCGKAKTTAHWPGCKFWVGAMGEFSAGLSAELMATVGLRYPEDEYEWRRARAKWLGTLAGRQEYRGLLAPEGVVMNHPWFSRNQDENVSAASPPKEMSGVQEESEHLLGPAHRTDHADGGTVTFHHGTAPDVFAAFERVVTEQEANRPWWKRWRRSRGLEYLAGGPARNRRSSPASSSSSAEPNEEASSAS